MALTVETKVESISYRNALNSVLRTVAFSLALWMPLRAATDDPTGLNIQVIEGEGQVYGLGSRATRGITVQISDDLGRPMDGATVTFRLPEEGPSGTFANGTKTEIATTRADGRVNAWGMQWNQTAGSFEVRITAAKGGLRAGTICTLTLSKAGEGLQAARSAGGHGGHKWVWIALGVGAAAAGGMVAAHGGFIGSSPPSTAAVSITRIGTPTILIGHP